MNGSKIAELKSLASRAAQIKDYLSAVEFYSKVLLSIKCHPLRSFFCFVFPTSVIPLHTL